ncbi:U3 small nucleolar ribonucleoprotein LCP5 [Meyerozyma sp. JA9]|nr:U3 small nucleolar ribonucleoprotein LCP5 [Meyerozyma sp. JA9]
MTLAGMAANVDDLLQGIIDSAEATQRSVSALEKSLSTDTVPELVQDMLKKLGQSAPEGLSLLSLKNSALLSYINQIALVTLCHLKRMHGDDVEEARNQAIENSIAQRVCLEKGVKPLEKKLNYQLEKMIGSYVKMKENEQKLEQSLEKNGSVEDSDSDAESDDEKLAHRPDAAALAKLSKPKDSDTTSTKEKYRPPKISAVAPPTKDAPVQRSNRKLQSMEEYLRESSDLPQVDQSIGTNIVDHGRGGIKTQAERKREKEIQDYEESNFIRLPSTSTKTSAKQKRHNMMNTFAGEDWSMFNNSRDISSSTSRKRKPNSVWDRVKRKRT